MSSAGKCYGNSFTSLAIAILIIFQNNLCPIDADSMKMATFTSLKSVIANRRIDTDLVVEKINYRKLNCMSDCLTDVNCESVGYHNNQKRCRLYRVLISGSDGVPENGWKYFSIREDFCPTENFTHNRIADVCYAISPERKPCGEAATICSSLSARLLVVDSQKKQDWARDLCVRQNIEGVHFDVYFEREGSALKLGSSGMDLTYTNWAIGQPDYGQPCIGMEAWHEWRWHDYVRSLEAGIICEIRRP